MLTYLASLSRYWNNVYITSSIIDVILTRTLLRASVAEHHVTRKSGSQSS